MISDWSEFVLLLYLASQQQSVVAIFQEKVQWQLCHQWVAKRTFFLSIILM
jgi:hypothetical protein